MNKINPIARAIIKEKKFYWNEDTLDYFKFQSNYQSKEENIKEITNFVKHSCSLCVRANNHLGSVRLKERNTETGS